MKKKEKSVDVSLRPMVMSQANYEMLFNCADAGVHALFNFYCYTAVWQKTNQPKCTVSYVAKGLGVSQYSVKKWRKQLLEAGLIEDVKIRDDNGNIKGHFVKVNYYSTTPSNIEWVADSTTNACKLNKRNACKLASRKPLVKDNELLTFDDKMADILHKLLVDKYSLPRRVKASSWSKEILKMRIIIMGNYTFCHKGYNKKKYIRALFTWYKKHYGEKYIPRLNSKADLVNKFIKIMSAYERSLEETGEAVKITKAAKIIAEQLKKKDWHPKSKEQLEVVVQKSLNNYTPLFRTHQELKELRTLKSFCKKQLSSLMYTPEVFVRCWFNRIFDLVQDWKKWKGDLTPYIFDVDHKLFDERGEELSNDWHHSTDAWTKYKRALKSIIIKDGK